MRLDCMDVVQLIWIPWMWCIRVEMDMENLECFDTVHSGCTMT